MSNRRRPRRPAPIVAVRRYNAYRCDDCSGAWLTVDLHDGVTPMFSPCFATEGCLGRAVLSGLLPADRDLAVRTFLAGLGRGPEVLEVTA